MVAVCGDVCAIVEKSAIYHLVALQAELQKVADALDQKP
jgi:hypothetical protein